MHNDHHSRARATNRTTTRNTSQEERLGRAVLDVLKSPASQRQIEKALRGLGERFDALEHTLTATGRRLDQFEQVQRELAQAVRALYQKHESLEEASRRNSKLTEDHYARHIIEPLARHLMEFLDLAESFAQAGESQQREALIAGAFDLLTVYGIERIIADAHDPFDPAVMKPVMRVPTGCADLDRAVHSVIRPGYRFGERVLRPVEIRLYIHSAQAA